MKSVICAYMINDLKSRPSRGAWIEIYNAPFYGCGVWVAPLAGRVD